MIKVLGYPYLSLDKYVDLNSFDNIIDDILIGIAKSKYAAGPTNPGPGYTDTTRKSIYEIYREIIADEQHPYYNTVKSLKNWEPYTFIQYKWPSHTLGQCLVLRSSGIGQYDAKADASKNTTYPISENFKSFFEFIESQNIFSSLGRVVIFLTEKGTETLEHSDYKDRISRKDQFIWISPMNTKKFYIKDEEGNKIYINSKFAFFDNANVHGTEQAIESTFSIRVDGIFSDEFRRKTKLDSHFN